MKLWKLVGIFLVALLAVFCSKKSEPVMVQLLPCACSYELQHIDSIMQSRPDSALVLLLSYPAQKEDETLSDSLSVKNDGINAFAAMLNRNYFYLLVSEALFKTDNMQTVRPQVQQAECFFDSLAMQHPDNDDITFLSARSHYMNGVGFYENDSVVEACKEYLNALEIMEAHFNEDEFVGQKAKFMALSYTRLTELFSDHYLHEQAIAFCKKVLTYYNKYNVTYRHVAWTLSELGSHYESLRQHDTADYYYMQALEVSDTLGLLYRDIVARRSFLMYHSKGEFEKSLSILKDMLTKAETRREEFARCLSIGELYYLEKQYDSAWIYLKTVFDGTTSLDARKLSAQRLHDICVLKSDTIAAASYSNYLAKFAMSDIEKSELYSQLNILVVKTEQARHERQNILASKKHLSSITSLICIILLFAVTAIIFIIFGRKKKTYPTNPKYGIRQFA